MRWPFQLKVLSEIVLCHKPPEAPKQLAVSYCFLYYSDDSEVNQFVAIIQVKLCYHSALVITSPVMDMLLSAAQQCSYYV